MKNSKGVILSSLYFLLSTFLIGCAEIEPPSPDQILRQPLGESPLRIGMTKARVRSFWGEPDIVRVLGADPQGMVKEEWVYRGRYPNLPINVDFLSETQRLLFDGDHLVKFEHRK